MNEVTKKLIKERIKELDEEIEKTKDQINLKMKQSEKVDGLMYAEYLHCVGNLYIQLGQMVADKFNLLKDLE